MGDRARVVVCGAGFAGVKVAKRLESECDVTLVAPTDTFVYLPLIHEVLSESVLPRDVSKPLAEILPRTRLVHGRAARVDGKTLVTAAGETIPFDSLVVAIGAEPNDFGVRGVAEHALSFYSVGDALRANATLKMKATEVNGRPLRIVVAGASFTGVEVAGECHDLLAALDVDHEIVLLDALDGLFPRQNEAFRSAVEKGCERAGLGIRLGVRITEVLGDRVRTRTADGANELPADVVFWCAGVKPRRLDGVDPKVRPTLQSASRDDIYVVGDAAEFPREQGVPKLAQTAEDQARVVAHNILNPGAGRAYEVSVKGIILSIGHGYAVAQIGGQVWSGQVPWHVKRTLYKAKIALA